MNNMDPNAMYGLNNQVSNQSSGNYNQNARQPIPIATGRESINNISSMNTMNRLYNANQINMGNMVSEGSSGQNRNAVANNADTSVSVSLNNNTNANPNPNTMYEYPPQMQMMPYVQLGCTKNCGASEPIDFQYQNQNHATLSDYTANPIVDNMPTPINSGNTVQQFVEPEDEMSTQLIGNHSGLTQTPATTLAQDQDISEDMTPQMTTGNATIVSTDSLQYMNGYLRTQVGKMAEIEFLVGNNNTAIKRGYITNVGANYIILRELNSNGKIICDYYNIKFVTIFDDTAQRHQAPFL